MLGLDLDEPADGQPPMPMRDVIASAYFRMPFQLDRDPSKYARLQMHVRFDDGFVAYLNGEEWVSLNAPGRNDAEGELAWNSESARGAI